MVRMADTMRKRKNECSGYCDYCIYRGIILHMYRSVPVHDSAFFQLQRSDCFAKSRTVAGRFHNRNVQNHLERCGYAVYAWIQYRAYDFLHHRVYVPDHLCSVSVNEEAAVGKKLYFVSPGLHHVFQRWFDSFLYSG